MRRFTKIAVVLAFPLVLGGCGVNTIPTQEEIAKTKFADLQAQYQRRADLIPNLVATVKGYAAQEKSVLVEVTQARASATQIHVDPTAVNDQAQIDKFAAAQNGLSGALSRLLVASERYPQLQSDQNFLALQSQLEGTENRITIARRDYNNSARVYNTTLHTFPGVVWASTLYHAEKPMALFQASEAAQSAPTVNFDATSPAAPNAGTAPASNTAQ
ncbi:MAG: LemA family protein [Caulobacteraceae bacterium]